MFDNNGSFLLAMFEFFFFAWFMALWWIFGDLFRSADLGGVAKTLWCLFIIFLPWIGIFVYLIARGGMTERSMEAQRKMQEAQATTSARWPPVMARPEPALRTRSPRRSRCSTRHHHSGRVRPAQGEGAGLTSAVVPRGLLSHNVGRRSPHERST